ncbi:MAG: MBL fold metallo-hydrolase [Thermoanaerobaculia bacterium]|nr:MBL fold metallo-hydrolase [Thermoanaerobaculia bacterium]
MLRSLIAVLVLAAALGASPVEAQGGGSTRLVILGTGTPIADPSRSGPGVAIVVGSRSYLVDAGPGIVRRAASAFELGFDALHASSLTRVFITHLHSDHTLGLPDLMFTPWQNGREAPLEVWGPPGIRRMTDKIAEAWVEDVYMRLFGLESVTRRDYRAVPHEVEGGRIYDDGVVVVDAIPVEHLTWPHAFGYRFRTPDRTIVVSGDARPSPSLAEACDGCDILVHEVYSEQFFGDHPNQAYHRAAHTSAAELAELATRARPGLLVLYHQLLGGATDDELEAEMRAAGYRGAVVSARDLDVF